MVQVFLTAGKGKVLAGMPRGAGNALTRGVVLASFGAHVNRIGHATIMATLDVVACVPILSAQPVTRNE
jgi:hypothetical protein